MFRIRGIFERKGRTAILLGLAVLVLASGFGDARVFQAGVTPASAAQQENPAIRIIADEAYLNKLVIEALEGDANLSRPVVDLQEPNLVVVTVSVRIRNFITVRPAVTLALDVVDEAIKTEVRALEVVGVTVPPALVAPQVERLKNRTERKINRSLVSSLEELGLVLTAVSATDDALILDLENEKPLIR